MATLLVLIAACAVLGFVVARLWVVAVSVVVIVAFYVGLDSGWWGDGTGEAWPLVMLLVIAVAAAVTAAAVGLARVLRR